VGIRIHGAVYVYDDALSEKKVQLWEEKLLVSVARLLHIDDI